MEMSLKQDAENNPELIILTRDKHIYIFFFFPTVT